MKKSSRILSLFLAVLMVFSSLPVFSSEKLTAEAATAPIQLNGSTSEAVEGGTYNLFNSGITSDSSINTSEYTNPSPDTYTNGGKDLYGNYFSSSSGSLRTIRAGLEFTVNSALPYAKLSIKAFDVDEESGETDIVYLVDKTSGTKTRVGTLSGRDWEWNNTSINIPSSYFTVGHTYCFEVYVDVRGWETWIRTVSLETENDIDASLDASIDANGTVTANLAVTTKTAMKLNIEYKAEIANCQFGSATANLSNSANVANTDTKVFQLENGAYKGTYTIYAFVCDESGNVLITAQCNCGYNYFAVNYNTNGGINNVPVDTNPYEAGETATVLFTPAPESKDGRKFCGWSENPNATLPTYTANGTNTIVVGTSDVTLYAVYAASFTATLSGTKYTFNNAVKKPTATVKNSEGATLTNGKDYSVEYCCAKGCKTVGTHTVTITGIGNYSGTETRTFTIEKQPLEDSRITLSYTAVVFDGTAKKPTVTVKSSQGTTLTNGTSYTVNYCCSAGCKTVGTHKVTITGKGNYSGTVTKTFTIMKDLKVDTATLSCTEYTFDTAVKKPTVTVKNIAGTTITEGISYTVKYCCANGCKTVGTHTVTITGIGNYSGTITRTFTIAKQPLDASRITLSYTTGEFDNTVKKPGVTVKSLQGTTLTNGTSYTVSYCCSGGCKTRGTHTVTITGKGNYSGTVKKTFTIKKDLTIGTATLFCTAYSYNGEVRKPTVTVKNSDGTILTKGTSYTVEYCCANGCKTIGTHTVTITGMGNYSGTIKKTFTIYELITGYQIIDSYIYYYGADGVRYENKEYDGNKFDKYGRLTGNNIFVTINNNTYYLVNNAIITGYYLINNVIYYFGTDGVRYEDRWHDGHRFDKDGKLTGNNTFVTINNNTYYLVNNTVITGYYVINNVIYYFGTDGVRYENKDYEGHEFDEKGRLTGNNIFITINNNTYYLVNNTVITGYYVINNVIYYFGTDGVRYESKEYDGHKFNKNGKLIGNNTFVTINNNTYYLVNNTVVTGYYIVNNVIYYFGTDGVRYESKDYEGHEFDESGKLTGNNIFVTINNNTYYLVNNRIVKGYYVINNVIYYFGTDGVRYESKEYDGYKFDENGSLIGNNTFITINNNTYYLVNNIAVTGEHIINSHRYIFNSEGVLTYSEGHKYSEWVVITAPTCVNEGEKERSCACGDTQHEKIPVIDHTDADDDGCCDNCGQTIECSHICHKTGLLGFIWDAINLFNKLFKINQYCECGAKHW